MGTTRCLWHDEAPPAANVVSTLGLHAAVLRQDQAPVARTRAACTSHELAVLAGDRWSVLVLVELGGLGCTRPASTGCTQCVPPQSAGLLP